MKLFIIGAQGTGKTRIAKELADTSGLSLVDAWNGVTELPRNCVVTTQLERQQIYQFPDALFVSPTARA